MIRVSFPPRTNTLAPSREPKPPKGPRIVSCQSRACRKRFIPDPPWLRCCCDDCGVAIGLATQIKQKAKRERAERATKKVERQEDKARLEALKPRKWFLAKAKVPLHAYIRARDEGQPCISCDTILVVLGRAGGDYDAGHFRSVGSAKHLEFDERNIFGQCKHCNDYLKGHPLEYERRLRIRKGDAYVDAIKADDEPRHLTIDDFKQIEAHYKAKLKLLKEAA